MRFADLKSREIGRAVWRHVESMVGRGIELVLIC